MTIKILDRQAVLHWGIYTLFGLITLLVTGMIIAITFFDQKSAVVLTAKIVVPSILLLVSYYIVTSQSYRAVILALIAITVTGLLMGILMHNGLQGTAIMYIGLPLILVYIFKNTYVAKNVTGHILKGITIVLLLSAPVLQEGFICIIMSAPLFYIIGGITGLAIDYSRKKALSKLQASPLILLAFIMTLEGVHPDLSFNRDHTVRVEKIIAANTQAVEAQLNKPLVLGADVPLYLKLFPFPTVKEHQGTQVGQQTTLNFVYNKHFYFNPKIGDLTYEVTARGANFIESKVKSDTSYVDSYMDWKHSKVSWQAIDDAHTRVTWEISYYRKLDPAWYFGTLEYFTTKLMAKALIKYAATPEASRGSS